MGDLGVSTIFVIGLQFIFSAIRLLMIWCIGHSDRSCAIILIP